MAQADLEAHLAALEREAEMLEDAKVRLEVVIAGFEQREELRDERDRLSAIIHDLHIDALHATIVELRDRIAGLTPRPVQGNYTFMQFLTRLVERTGYVKGAQLDYALGSQSDGDEVRPVGVSEIYRWHSQDRVPAWAYEQIDKIRFPDRISGAAHPEWTSQEMSFLVNALLEQPLISNAELAYQCSQQFGREVSENAVKGMITRRRAQGELPRRRTR